MKRGIDKGYNEHLLEKNKGTMGALNAYSALKSKLFLIFLFLIIIMAGFLFYYLVLRTNVCENRECYNKAIETCNKVFYVKESEKANWLYRIKDNYQRDVCKVEVRLLEVRQGSIDLAALEDKKMICYVRKGSKEEPEEDLSSCTGVLKEELQEILIQKMHNYLLENLGDIEKEFIV